MGINVKHTYFGAGGTSVRIDTVICADGTEGSSGYAFRIGERVFTRGGFETVGKAKAAARRAIPKAKRDIEKGREAIEKSMREMSTIRGNENY